MAILSRGILVSTTPSSGGGDSGPVAWTDVTDKPASFPSSWATITDKPSVFPTEWATIADKPTFAAIATTGSVADIVDFPLPTTAGTNGQILSTNELGQIVWSDAPAGGITALEDDTSPTLGGNLTIPQGRTLIGSVVAVADEIGSAGEISAQDPVNSRSITLSPSLFWMDGPEMMNASVLQHQAAAGYPFGISSSGDLYLHSASADVIIQGLTYPQTDGTDGQILATDGAGNLAFIDAPTGGGTTAVTVTTTDATPTELLRFTVAADTIETRDLTVRGLGPSGGYVDQTLVAYRNDAGVVTLVGNAASNQSYDAGAAAWSVDYVISGTDVVVQVTGAAEEVVWTTHVPDAAVTVVEGGGALTSPELINYRVPFATPTISSGAVTLDCNTANAFEVTLSENITGITITNAVETQIVLLLRQDATGGRTVAGWPANVMWPGGTEPTVTATANAVDMVALVYNAALDAWLANAQQDYS